MFRSQTGNPTTVTIDLTSGSGGGLELKNITDISFRNMSFIGTLNLGINAKDIEFNGCRFNTSTVTSFPSLIKSNQYNQNISFINNYFKGAVYIFQYTHAFGSVYPKGLVIKGNIFEDAFMGIEINNVDSLIVDSNYFYRSVPYTANSHAIRIMSPKNHFEITGNVIK
jgi:hypothetical protein